MPRLSVQFELEVASAQKQGQQAGSQFATGFAQGLSSKGKAEAEAWMKNLSATARASMMAQLGITSGGVIRPPSEARGLTGILKLLNLVQTQNINPSIKGLRDIGGADLAKVFGMGQFNASGNTIKGLRDITGSDLAKVAALGEAAANFGTKIKGLRDVTGKDLAKVQALPDITSYGSGRMKSLLLGLGAAPFSSWIGARLLSDAAFGGKGGGGGHGGLLGAGGAGGFAEFYIGIEVLKKAFDYGAEKIKQVINKGFDLYVNASRLHTTVGRFFSTEEAGKQAGLSESQIEQFMLRNQWGRARTSLQNFGVMSSLRGMSKDFQDAYRWASEIQGQWEATARTSYEIKVNFERMKTDWLTMWNDSGFLTALDKLSKWTDEMLHFGAKNGFSIPQFALSLLVPSLSGFSAFKGGAAPASSSAPLFNLPRQLPTMNQFEKMGFNIGGVKTTQSLLEKANGYLQEIAQGISRVAKGETGGSSHGLGYPGSSGALHNIP